MDVSDVMTCDVLTVSSQASVREAARLMIDGGFSGLPVVDDGRLVGILSEADYLVKDGSQSWISRALVGAELSPMAEVEFVSELMSTPAVTVANTASVQEAARIMTRKGLKRLAVLNSDREVVGIVTRADLIRAYVRPDAEIAGEIRQMLAVLPAPLSGLAVEVLDGVAVLSGDVETSAEARAVSMILSGIEGVARVRNDLDWEVATELGDNPYSGYPLEGVQV